CHAEAEARRQQPGLATLRFDPPKDEIHSESGERNEEALSVRDVRFDRGQAEEYASYRCGNDAARSTRGPDSHDVDQRDGREHRAEVQQPDGGHLQAREPAEAIDGENTGRFVVPRTGIQRLTL